MLRGLPDVENINPSSSLRSAHRRLRIDTAAPESGTTCSLFIFIRAAGMVQTAPFRSISDHEASLVSPDRTALRIVNRSASRPAVSGSFLRRVTSAGTSAYGKIGRASGRERVCQYG